MYISHNPRIQHAPLVQADMEREAAEAQARQEQEELERAARESEEAERQRQEEEHRRWVQEFYAIQYFTHMQYNILLHSYAMLYSCAIQYCTHTLAGRALADGAGGWGSWEGCPCGLLGA